MPALMLLSACAGLPTDYPRESSSALPVARDSRAGQASAEWFSRSDGTSGILPLADGDEALGARLRMIAAAENSIDIQYFLMKPDLSARLIAESLLEAADRGVRVRFLLDDVFTTAPDEALAVLDRHPNIEMRLFSPVARGGPNWLNFLRDFPRTNRRMHNKSFTVDNAVTIVGGRNIADEYYAIQEDIEFADFDIAVFGPAAEEVSETFDQYWNSKLSIPVGAFAEIAEADLPRARAIGKQDPETLARAEALYNNALNQMIFKDLRAGRVAPITGEVHVITDPVAKLGYPVGSGHDTLYQEIVREIEEAETEVFIISPYFVPQRKRVDLLKRARARGVRVVVVTNSLASTNHPYVHGGYYPWRRELLSAGVEIFEAKADSAVSDTTGEMVALTLHTKAVIIDRKTSFIGSLNMDPRSIDINSEMGLFIGSEEFGSGMAEAIEANFPPYVFKLELGPDGKEVWRHGAESWRSEPGASGFNRFVAGLFAFLPVDGQL